MSVILILILVSVAVATGFLIGFIWAVRSGQYEDTHTPSLRALLDDPPRRQTHSSISPDSKHNQQ